MTLVFRQGNFIIPMISNEELPELRPENYEPGFQGPAKRREVTGNPALDLLRSN